MDEYRSASLAAALSTKEVQAVDWVTALAGTGVGSAEQLLEAAFAAAKVPDRASEKALALVLEVIDAYARTDDRSTMTATSRLNSAHFCLQGVRSIVRQGLGKSA